MNFEIGSLRELYRTGQAKQSEIVALAYERIAETANEPIWISLIDREQAIARARQLEDETRAKNLSLPGIPFAIKDNIDFAGLPTTAGCPAYAYSPAKTATVVQRLIDAGAVLIGKTNMDQFATGLVGTRSPYGACSCVFDKNYISGGSSSGSAVAVARGLVSFSLGTDTAGSGRVPAAFNNLVGLKPTRGLLSTTGVVPACRSLDCISIFTTKGTDAQEVWRAAKGFDASDSLSRTSRLGEGTAPWLGSRFKFGVPRADQLEFFGDDEAASLFQAAIARFESIGGEKVEIDFSIFRAAADLLYSGPWVAERLAAIEPFIDSHADEMDPTVRQIISNAKRFSAVDAFRASYRLEELRRAAEREWDRMDVMVLPTTGTIYTHAQIAEDPVRRNTNLGHYTNFVNLLDLAAIALPAGFRTNGLPFGISIIGKAFTDEALLALGEMYMNGISANTVQPGCVQVAVVGAHLAGQPLNAQLTSIGARLKKATRTAANYRLYALAGTNPPKPGLVRDDEFEGLGIEVEVWSVPEDRFGGFVAEVLAPLGIGNAVLENGETVKCFICEPYAICGATEITLLGGWRNYLAQKAST